MLAMARGLATEPALLLLDELSMGLAPIIVEELYEIVAQIARDGVSILVVEQFARTVLGRGRLRGHHGARPDREGRAPERVWKPSCRPPIWGLERKWDDREQGPSRAVPARDRRHEAARPRDVTRPPLARSRHRVDGRRCGARASSPTRCRTARRTRSQQNDAITLGLGGIAAAVVGAALFLRYSIASFLRFWLARLIYEQKAQTDRLLEWPAATRLRLAEARLKRLQAPASSRNATSLSTRGSPGRPSTRSPITLRWICSVPPPMRLLHCIRNCCCQ